MNQLVRLQFRRLAELLAAQAAVAGGIGHSATAGALRELVVERFLRPHLPAHLTIRSGVIIDSKGSKSRQQDIILVDASFPTISVGGEREALVIAESVIATIEVKTNLTAPELQSTLEAVTVTKRLFRSGELCYSKRGAEMRFPPHPILSYVFAFDGATLDTLVRVMFDYCTEKNDGGLAPEGICVLTRGTILRASLMPTVKAAENKKDTVVKLPKLGGVDVTYLPEPKDALLRFYGRLRDEATPLKLINYDLDPYFDADDTGGEQVSVRA